MKKVLKVLSAAMLSALVAVSAATCVSAASDINSAEQAILDELGTPYTVNGIEKTMDAAYIGQAKTYFLGDSVDLSQAQADAVIAKIREGKALVEASGASTYAELSDADFNQLAAIAVDAAKAGDATITVTRGADSKPVVSLITKTDDGKTVTPTGPSTGDDGVIKTTGFDVPSVTAVAGVGVLMVAAAGVYLMKTSKKESVDA